MVLDQRDGRGVPSLAPVDAMPQSPAPAVGPELIDPPALEGGLLYRVVFDDRPWGGFRARFVGWEPSRLGHSLELGRVARWDNGIRLAEGNWRVERILTPPGIGASDVAA